VASLLYASPTGMHPHVGYSVAMRANEITCMSFGRREVSDFRWATGPVHMARTRIAHLAMDGRCFEEHDHKAGGCKAKPYDFVLMHDDDLVVGPQAIAGSNGKAVNPLDVWHDLFDKDPKLGVIGACYMLERPLKPNVVNPHPNYPEELLHVLCGFPAAPIEVGGVGTGCMMIRTSVLQELDDVEDQDGGPPMFRFPLTPTRWGMIAETGEDYDFCKRVRALGYKVVADPRWQTTHMKQRGPLHYNQAEWEANWKLGIPAALAQEYHEQIHPSFGRLNVNGLLCLDHTPVRELDAKEWRARCDARDRAREAA
jgi:hypothetical protein